MIVYWKVDDDTLTIELQGQTNGWIGMYFSGGRFRRGMKNADITLASMIKGVPYVKDLFSKTTYNRMVDDRQDVKVISGEEADGWTTVQFEKTIQKTACNNGNDDCQDVVLTNGPVNLCVALANSDMTKDATRYAYHTWRSTGDCETIDFFKEAEKETAATTTQKPVTTKKAVPVTTKKPVPVTTKKPVPKPNCEDKYKFCPNWAELGYCKSYSAFMSRNCKNSCNKCT